MNQYLTGSRIWYISSPLSLSHSGALNTGDNKLWEYDEANVVWNSITKTDELLGVMKGYVFKPLNEGLITFSEGEINNGNITIPLNRTENTNPNTIQD